MIVASCFFEKFACFKPAGRKQEQAHPDAAGRCAAGPQPVVIPFVEGRGFF